MGETWKQLAHHDKAEYELQASSTRVSYEHDKAAYDKVPTAAALFTSS